MKWFRILVFACGLAMCPIAAPVTAQINGVWEIEVGTGSPVRITLYKSNVSTLPGVQGHGEVASSYTIEMRGELAGKTWLGEWHWLSDSIYPAGMPGCPRPFTPSGYPASHATRHYGKFDIRFNPEERWFTGTWKWVCKSTDDRVREGPPVPIRGVRKSNTPVRRDVESDRRTPDAREGDIRPIQFGEYETTWGRGRLTSNGSLDYPGDSTLNFEWLNNLYGTIDGRTFYGRYFVTGPRGYGEMAAPACTVPWDRANRTHSDGGGTGVPIWGAFRVVFAPSGKSFAGHFSPCRQSIRDPLSSENHPLSGNLVTLSAAPLEVIPPSVPLLPRDGPCRSMSAAAVASIEPCTLAPPQPLHVSLLKDVPGGITRVVFTPLGDDLRAIDRAIATNRALPQQPYVRDVYQSIPTGKLRRVGDTLNLIVPGGVCRYDYWSVSLVDGTGVVHKENGIVKMQC